MTGREIFDKFLDELVKGSDRKSVMLMIAGPNGAGKTTLWHRFLKKNLPESFLAEYINVDDVERELNPNGPRAVQTDVTARYAQLEAERQRAARIATAPSNHSHFIYEAVFSDAVGRKLAELQRGRDAGYRVVMVFIGLDDVELAQARVRNRVRNGGHDVPAATQIDRFSRVFENARKALPIVSLALFLDNTRDDHEGRGSHRPVAVYCDGICVGAHQNLPLWWQYMQ